MPEISRIFSITKLSATKLAMTAWKRVVIKGIYTTYVYIPKYMRMSFSQLLCAIFIGQCWTLKQNLRLRIL